jgi:hypothetical protein
MSDDDGDGDGAMGSGATGYDDNNDDDDNADYKTMAAAQAIRQQQGAAWRAAREGGSR